MLERISYDYGAWVRLLIGRGHTTKDIGQRIGLTQPSVSRIACGRTRSIGADAAFRLLELAGGQITLPPAVRPDGVCHGVDAA